MKKIMLFVLVGFSLMLFGCNSQTSNTNDQNLVEENNEEVVIEEVKELEENNDVINIDNEEAIEQPVVDNISATESLAKCLTAKGAKMYGTETCPYCMKQKETFGNDFKHINYINCAEQPAVCGNANIQGVPAWEFADGSQKAGLQSLENLAALAGCEYKG